MIHIVKQGETVTSVAYEYGVSPMRLMYDNQLRSENLVVGQALLVLIPELTYTVSQGDTLFSIGEEYGVTIADILRKNPYLLEQEYLNPGQVLVISYTEAKNGTMELTGYAYPFIEDQILNEVLLYINDLLVFSYGFTRLGDVIPPQGEQRLIDRALAYNKNPILVLTPFSETGTFDNQLVKAVVSDLPMQQRLIETLRNTLHEKGYEGVDVDFEYILADDREGYATFVQNLKTALEPEGYKVSVALAPKNTSDQSGLLYEGIDYALLGQAADFVFLMTYEWGYTYGPPMAVAPIHKVRQVLDYAVTEISSEKIIMGIPNYAYDWPLPYERGVTKAATIGNVQAVDIARRQGVPIEFDEIAMSPFFQYETEGIVHEVWFEDVRSIQTKLDTVKEYVFHGAGYWNLMRPFRANWLLADSRYNLL